MGQLSKEVNSALMPACPLPDVSGMMVESYILCLRGLWKMSLLKLSVPCTWKSWTYEGKRDVTCFSTCRLLQRRELPTSNDRSENGGSLFWSRPENPTMSWMAYFSRKRCCISRLVISVARS